MLNYSQNDEQERIVKYFGGSKNGTFIDIGANDGVTLSNTYALARHYGWTGLLIEASPKAYDKLLANYQEEIFKDREVDLVNVAVGHYDSEKPVPFYEGGSHLGKGDVGLLSTLKEEELKRWKGQEEFDLITVPMESISTILSRSRFQKFDLLSIDIEGMELEVLPTIPFVKMGVKMALVEWNGKNQLQYDKIMRSSGFRLIHKNGENLIYVK